MGDNLKSASTKNIEKLLEIKIQKHGYFKFFDVLLWYFHTS